MDEGAYGHEHRRGWHHDRLDNLLRLHEGEPEVDCTRQRGQDHEGGPKQDNRHAREVRRD